MSEEMKTTKAQGSSENKAGVRVLKAQDLSLTEAQRKAMDPKDFAINVRALRQNWRQGTVAVKGRAEVALTGKKPFRQKGTGRARAGTARSPIWRSGGVCHGPQERTRTLKLSKSSRRNVLGSLLWSYLDQGKIVCIGKDLGLERPKTKVAYNALKDAGLQGKKVNVFVQGNDPLTYASFANIENVQTLLFDQANAFDLSIAHSWVVLEKDMNAFKEMVSKWL